MNENLNKVFLDDIRNFFKTHECFKPMCHCNDGNGSMTDEEIAKMVAKQANLFCQIRPKAVDILVEKEYDFVDAIRQLIEKHKSLETVEQIDKFTKDILKLCK